MSAKQATIVSEKSIRAAAATHGQNSAEAKALREAERRKSAGEQVVFSRLGGSIGVSNSI